MRFVFDVAAKKFGISGDTWTLLGRALGVHSFRPPALPFDMYFRVQIPLSAIIHIISPPSFTLQVQGKSLFVWRE
jgi:hypothetical protein